jgi:hypothetical protein
MSPRSEVKDELVHDLQERLAGDGRLWDTGTGRSSACVCTPTRTSRRD